MTFTAGSVGALSITCAVSDGTDLKTASATVNVVAPPTTPVVRFFTASTAVPLATQGRPGLTAFVDAVPGATHTWTVTGGTITSTNPSDSVVYTAGTGASVTLSVIETNAAGDSGSAAAVTQPLTAPGIWLVAGQPGGPGNLDGVGSAARLSFPIDLTVRPDGTAYVLDRDNGTVRSISPSGQVATVAGGATLVFDGGLVTHLDGSGSDAGFSRLRAIAGSPSGALYIADDQQIRRLDPDASVTTFCGSGAFGSTDGDATHASFGTIAGIATDSSENVYVTGSWFGTVRELTAGNCNTATLASGLPGPHGIAISSDGGVFIWNPRAATCTNSAQEQSINRAAP